MIPNESRNPASILLLKFTLNIKKIRKSYKNLLTFSGIEDLTLLIVSIFQDGLSKLEDNKEIKSGEVFKNLRHYYMGSEPRENLTCGESFFKTSDK